MSFDIKANKKSCSVAAELTGINPINDDNLMNNYFAELTPEIERFITKKRNFRKNDEISINYQFITDIENINTMINLYHAVNYTSIC